MSAPMTDSATLIIMVERSRKEEAEKIRYEMASVNMIEVLMLRRL